MIWNTWSSRGLVDRSPVPRRLLPEIPERPPNRLADAEVEELVRLPDPHGFVIRLGLGAGLGWGNLAALQQVLGHSMVVTTQRYARLTDEAVRREAERIYEAAV